LQSGLITIPCEQGRGLSSPLSIFTPRVHVDPKDVQCGFPFLWLHAVNGQHHTPIGLNHCPTVSQLGSSRTFEQHFVVTYVVGHPPFTDRYPFIAQCLVDLANSLIVFKMPLPNEDDDIESKVVALECQPIGQCRPIDVVGSRTTCLPGDATITPIGYLSDLFKCDDRLAPNRMTALQLTIAVQAMPYLWVVARCQRIIA